MHCYSLFTLLENSQMEQGEQYEKVKSEWEKEGKQK
jgi:hypothetical protein